MGRPDYSALPSVDRLAHHEKLEIYVIIHGKKEIINCARKVLDQARTVLRDGGQVDEEGLAAAVAALAEIRAAPSLRRVFNLTGTVIHTNLGRAPMPREAIDAAAAVAGASNLEFDLETGRRGDRDTHVEVLLRELTGAEAATVVNNNAAAVLLVLNTFASGLEVPVSRGELIEIGGSFRIPEIMSRAGARLVEVGTTNRTHAGDFRRVVGEGTGCVMKVHPSNYAITGFTAGVGDEELAGIAGEAGVPYAVDLGAGQLVDLTRYGLPHEPTPAEVLAAGADLVTFSGDKLLGGPQAGIIVGGAERIAALKRNPLKRALRPGKLSLAALEALLRLYRNPETLPERLPGLRALVREPEEIGAQALRLLPAFGEGEVVTVMSQIGSGSLPVERLESRAIALSAPSGRALEDRARAYRRLPVPVIGRISEGALLFDLRALDDEEGLAAQLRR